MGDALSGYTTFGIGGRARRIVIATGRGELIDLSPRGLVLGRGSNVLVSDDGYDGVVVINRYESIEASRGVVTAGSGTRLHSLCRYAEAAGLSGLEWAIGIPGTVGGAVRMNAGAFGGRISDVLLYADVLRDGAVTRIPRSDLGLGYRESGLDAFDIVIEAAFGLKPDDASRIKARGDAFSELRRQKQPSGKSAGSIFKNPHGMSIGRLIEQAGLKGLSVGGAQISQKHANIIVNNGGATARDVCALIKRVKDELGGVGIHPQEEIVYIGEFD